MGCGAGIDPPAEPSTVLVTGATGYIASELVAQLVGKGYVVKAAARNLEKAAFLTQLPCGDRVQLVHLDLLDGHEKFVEAMQGCDAVFHTASPMTGETEESLVQPAVKGVNSVMLASSKTPSVKTVVMISSVAAIEPQPNPPMMDETMWSDPDEQRANRGMAYALSKTLAERAAWDFMELEARHFRLVTVLPSMVFGPSRQPGKESTSSLGFLRDWFAKGREECCPWYPDAWPHCHFSMVDVRDLCAHQIACLEQSEASGRYLSLTECDGWTELDKLMKELYPPMPLSAPVPEPVVERFGEPIADPIVSRWDLTRMKSLGVQVRPVRQVLEESLAFFRERGELQ